MFSKKSFTLFLIFIYILQLFNGEVLCLKSIKQKSILNRPRAISPNSLKILPNRGKTISQPISQVTSSRINLPLGKGQSSPGLNVLQSNSATIVPGTGNRRRGSEAVQHGPTHKLVTDLNKLKGHQGKFVQGHLVNQKLGGPGTPDNTLPFTSSLNRKHEVKLERTLKSTNSGFKLDTKAYYSGSNGVPYQIKTKITPTNPQTTQAKNLAKALEGKNFAKKEKNGITYYKGYFSNTHKAQFSKGGFKLTSNNLKSSSTVPWNLNNLERKYPQGKPTTTR